jgi:putative DNA primase/helicase
MAFDIRDHLEKLTVDRESSTEYRCICPVCDGNNLTVAKSSGAYSCHNGCQCVDIRNAIAPLNPAKSIRPKSDRTWTYSNIEGDPLIRTRRIDDGEGNRKIWQEYLIDGQWQAKSTPATKAAREAAQRAVMPYYYAAVQNEIANNEPIFWVEGEPCTEALESIGLTATTSIGGSAGYRKYGDYSQAFRGANLVICPDRDAGGLKYALEVAKDYPDAQWLYAFPDNPLWKAPSNDGGWDVADWINALKIEGLSTEQISDRIVAAVEPRRVAQNSTPRTAAALGVAAQHEGSDPAQTFLQRAEQQLYSDAKCICFGNVLYRWAGTHYQAHPDELEYPRIRAFANSFKVEKEDKEGNVSISYPFAKPRFVKEVLEWVKQGCSVPSDQVNPPGINCKNGVLEARWEGRALVVDLVPHEPTHHFYLSEPLVTHNPEADPIEYERLMQCLDAGSRNIWERTIAASLDLPIVRKWKGRAVRAVFLKGDGSNGKDTLRTITEMVLGYGAIASCSATDFKQYDQGRNFPIYPLRGKRVNWPSENADVGRVDELKGLRAAITGDPITFEAKNKMGTQEPCKAVFLFNVNEAPNLVAQLKATETRWGIVPFNKTYSLNPQQGEMQADPRFKEDPNFVQEKILPAFLNQLLVQLQAVVLEGIDYFCTQSAFEEMQREASHLLQFAHDTGLSYNPIGAVAVAELWFRLREWYIQTGTLIVEQRSIKVGEVQEKLTWNEQPRRGDRNVKGSNQVAQRFLEIFPKAKIGKQRRDGSNTYSPIITGIKFCSETAQDGQDAQDKEAKSFNGKGLQPSWTYEQLPKNCPRQTPQLPKMADDDHQSILGSSPPILPSSCPVDELPKITKTIDKEGLQASHLSHLGHLAQFPDKKLISDSEDDIDWEETA